MNRYVNMVTQNVVQFLVQAGNARVQYTVDRQLFDDLLADMMAVKIQLENAAAVKAVITLEVAEPDHKKALA